MRKVYRLLLTNYTKSSFIAFAMLFIFLAIFIFKANSYMNEIPFHDFDEAHRAEKAKRMKEYFSFLVPLTGSPVDRTSDLRVPFRDNPDLFLYYHPERPPFVYWLMITSTSIFGQSEWAYRLPSFIMGMLTILTLLVFIYLSGKVNFIALSIAALSIITSADLWLSSEYAQLDTSLTFFLLLNLTSLLAYVSRRQNFLLIISGLSLAMAILSKGQPAVIFIFPLIYLMITKKLSKKEVLKLAGSTFIIIGPWLFLLNAYFGLFKVMKIFLGFAAYSAVVEYSFIKAPFFWYARWWWDSFRPGWTLFLVFLILYLLNRNFDWKRNLLLSYILGGFIFFSLAVNKIWWYVLPLIPAISLFIYLSCLDYLKTHREGLLNLSSVIILASLPIFLAQSNQIVIIYGTLTTIICLAILRLVKVNFKAKFKNPIFIISILVSLTFFYLHFPKIEPYHKNTKYAAGYFSNLPGKKCLYILDMPPETALFYSNAGEVLSFVEGKDLLPSCSDYLITPTDLENSTLTYKDRGELLQLHNAELLFQKGTMRLYKI